MQIENSDQFNMSQLTKFKHLNLFLFLFCLIANTAIAEEGQYYGVVSSDLLSSANYGVGFGYQLSSTLSAEISYLSISKMVSVGTINTYSITGVNIGFVGYLPVSQSFGLVGKIGTFSSTAKGSSLATEYNNTTISTGLGVQFTASQTIFLTLIIDSLGTLKSSDKDMGWDYSQIMAGLRYSF